MWSTNLPVIVVEILSGSTRNEDLFLKTDDYRRAGIAQYWIIDGAEPSLIALVNASDHWEIGLALTDADPTGSIDVADLGEVTLDLPVLLR